MTSDGDRDRSIIVDYDHLIYRLLFTISRSKTARITGTIAAALVSVKMKKGVDFNLLGFSLESQQGQPRHSNRIRGIRLYWHLQAALIAAVAVEQI